MQGPRVEVSDAMGRVQVVPVEDDPLTIGFASPDALAVAWSYWPCTDMDFSLGTVGPGTPGTPGKAAATIHFLPGALETNLHRITVPHTR